MNRKLEMYSFKEYSQNTFCSSNWYTYFRREYQPHNEGSIKNWKGFPSSSSIRKLSSEQLKAPTFGTSLFNYAANDHTVVEERRSRKRGKNYPFLESLNRRNNCCQYSFPNPLSHHKRKTFLWNILQDQESFRSSFSMTL